MGAFGDGGAIGATLAKATREYVERALAARDSRIAGLERRLAEAEAKADRLVGRVERHAEHLGNLESKLRQAERGTSR